MQRLFKACKELLNESSFTDYSDALAPSLLLDNSIRQFWVVLVRSEGPSRLSLQKTLSGFGSPMKGEETVDTYTFDRSSKADDALRYRTYLMFDRLHSLLWSCNLYSEGEEYSSCWRYVQECSLLYQVLHNLVSPWLQSLLSLDHHHLERVFLSRTQKKYR